MSPVVRATVLVVAVLLGATVAVLAVVDLELGLLLRGAFLAYRPRDLVAAAGAALAVSTCVVVALRVRRGSLLWALPLPGVVALLVAGLATREPTVTEVVYDGSYVPLKGVTMSQSYSSSLTLDFDGSPSLDLVLVLLALAAGAAVPLGLSGRRWPRVPDWLRGACLAAAVVGAGLVGIVAYQDLRPATAFHGNGSTAIALALSGTALGLCALAVPRLLAGRGGPLLLVGPVCTYAAVHARLPVPVSDDTGSFGFFVLSSSPTPAPLGGPLSLAALAAGAAVPLLLLARDLRRRARPRAPEALQ